MLYTCKSLSKHSSKYKLHTLIFLSAVNLSGRNFCFHAIFNASSHGNRYKLIFSPLEVLELLPQPTTVHINIVKIIFTKFYYKTMFTKLYFQENWYYFALAENTVFCTQLIWIWLTKDRVIIFSVAPVMSEKKGKNPLLAGCLQHKTQKKGKINISDINVNFSSKLFLWPASTSIFHILENWYWQDHSFKKIAGLQAYFMFVNNW